MPLLVPARAPTCAFAYSPAPVKRLEPVHQPVPGMVHGLHHPVSTAAAGTRRQPILPAKTTARNNRRRKKCEQVVYPRARFEQAGENNRQLNGIMSMNCANVLQERRFPDVASKPSAASGTILRRWHCNCRDLRIKGSLKSRALWWLIRERDRR